MPEIRHPKVPIEYAEKWIAWNHAITRIIASGTSPAEVIEAAQKAGEPNPILDKVPRAGVHLIGARMR